ncbi:hypothetical protein HPT25_07705 [Bacillus sp. BRMEA1]|uniref:hypothetical protein n=1 Tax=Neobacillus endophyticus TaxID=2738405 RepID=UPI0015665EC1|nr:hypothetical protein [Neobacillus endophyticus]NRD77383.1 hypothetical protein [Neobacillus endophyticus]
MKPYQNLFYPFSQRENQATKSLLNVLEYIDPLCTKLFLEYLCEKEINTNEFAYTLQGVLEGRDLDNKAAFNYLLCIAENTQVVEDFSEKLTSIPDGGIYTKGLDKPINIVIETKVGEGRLSRDQINRHCSLFGGNKPREIYKTWDDIRAFFKGLNINANDKLTQLFLNQFEQFCLVYDLGFNERNREFWFIQFHAYYDIARKIDDLLLNGSIGHKVYVQKTRDNGISYNRDENRKQKRFAKLHVKGNEYILMLTFGTKKQNFAHDVRSQYNIDIVRGKKEGIKGYQATHEVWIPLEHIVEGLVHMDLVKDLSAKAYEVTYREY